MQEEIEEEEMVEQVVVEEREEEVEVEGQDSEEEEEKDQEEEEVESPPTTGTEEPEEPEPDKEDTETGAESEKEHTQGGGFHDPYGDRKDIDFSKLEQYENNKQARKLQERLREKAKQNKLERQERKVRQQKERERLEKERKKKELVLIHDPTSDIYEVSKMVQTQAFQEDLVDQVRLIVTNKFTTRFLLNVLNLQLNVLNVLNVVNFLLQLIIILGKAIGHKVFIRNAERRYVKS